MENKKEKILKNRSKARDKLAFLLCAFQEIERVLYPDYISWLEVLSLLSVLKR